MSAEESRKVVSRAVMEEDFRNQLFSDPDKALVGYDLTPDEINALRSIPAETIDEFANNLDERISMSLLYFGADAMGGEAMGGEAMGSEARGFEAMGGEAMGSEAEGSEAMGGEAMGSEARGYEAMGSEAEGSEAMGSEAEGSEAMGAEAEGSEAMGAGGAGASGAGNWLQRLSTALGIGNQGSGSGNDYY